MVSNNYFISYKLDSLNFLEENLPIASFVSLLFLIHDPLEMGSWDRACLFPNFSSFFLDKNFKFSQPLLVSLLVACKKAVS